MAAEEDSRRVGMNKFCQPCLRKDIRNVADIYCEDCGVYQCKECEKMHQFFPVMSNHKLVNADKAGDEGSKYDMKGLDQCKEHQNLMEFFCENETCCGECAVASHRNCYQVVEIEKTKELKNLDLLDIQREFLEIEDELKKIAHRLERSKYRFTKDATEVVDTIQAMQDNVNEMFEKLKETISMDIAKFQKQAFDNFDAKTAVCDSFIGELKQTVAEIDAVFEQESTAQQLIMAQNFKVKGTELRTHTEKLSVELKDFVLKFDFDESLKLPPAKHAMPGKLTINFIPAAEISSGVMVSYQKEQKVNLKLLASIDLKEGEDDVEEPLLTGLDFLSDGRLVTVDNKNKRCVVFNENLERLNSLALSTFPHGLVVLSEEEVAITTLNKYRLIFLNISKLNEICVVGECDVEKQLQSISMIDNYCMLVGCIDELQPVFVVSMRGEDEELDLDFPTKMYPSGCSACAYIRNHNKIVLSDRFAHTIYIYDIDTNARVKVVKTIKEPRGVAVGPSDCIFICSKFTNSVVQISHTGQILSSHVLDMVYPRSVGVSKDSTRLAVSNSSSGKVKLQLFSIELME